MTASLAKYGAGDWKALEDEALAEVVVGAAFRQELGRLRRMAAPARRDITNPLKRWARELKAATGISPTTRYPRSSCHRSSPRLGSLAATIAHICHLLTFALRRYGQLPCSIVDILKLNSNGCQQSWTTNELIGSYRLSTLLVILEITKLPIAEILRRLREQEATSLSSASIDKVSTNVVRPEQLEKRPTSCARRLPRAAGRRKRRACRAEPESLASPLLFSVM